MKRHLLIALAGLLLAMSLALTGLWFASFHTRAFVHEEYHYENMGKDRHLPRYIAEGISQGHYFAFHTGYDVAPVTEYDISLSFAPWISAILIILFATLWLMKPKRFKSGFCPSCGYDLQATPDRCPECGTVATVK